MTSHQSIAVVEDDAPLRAAIDDLLRSAGFQTQLFSSADSFLSSTGMHADLLITDIKLPGLSGFELLRRLIEGSSKLPVIVITALLDASVAEKAAELGAVACLLKPFNESSLLDAINSAFATRR